MSNVKTLIFDIETSPIEGYVWGTYQTDVVKVKKDWQLLSVAWKWRGDRGTKLVTAEGESDDHVVTETVRDLMDEADIVVAHNANGFDNKRVKTRMAYYAFAPPSPFKTVDTLAVAKRTFAFTSNRLDDLCRFLGIGGKIQTGGFATWEGCLNGDPKAWERLGRYNRNDVVILERLYEALLPWMDTHPNVSMIADNPDACPKCGVVGQMIRQGWRYHGVTKRPRYQCNACGGWCQGRKVERSSGLYVA